VDIPRHVATTFYRHFESKDALVLAYLEYRDQVLWDYLSQPTPPKDVREALTKFEQYVNWPEVIGCPFLRIASEFPDTAHPFHRLAIDGFFERLLLPSARDVGTTPAHFCPNLHKKETLTNRRHT
jgi:AcrR family transcriptional regulator